MRKEKKTIIQKLKYLCISAWTKTKSDFKFAILWCKKSIFQKLKDLWGSAWIKVKPWVTTNKIIFGLALIIILLIWAVICRMLGGTDERHWLDWLFGITKTGDFSAKYNTIKTLSLALFGALGIIGVVVAYKRAKALEDTAKIQAGMVETQSQANKDKTFNDAVKNLGNPSASVRLGGIYTLYELAKLEQKWQRNIAEILCAHLRETTQQEKYQKNYKYEPSNEIQSLLYILSEINLKYLLKRKKGDTINLLDLSKAYLRGANLTFRYLSHANLSHAQIQNADLSSTLMQGAKLQYARMQGTKLKYVRMPGADLSYAQMQGVDLSHARIPGADLSHAQMKGADLSNIDMRCAYLPYAEMQGAKLTSADMSVTYLFKVQMQGVELFKTKIQGAYTKDGESDRQRYHLDGSLIKKRCGKDTELENIIWKGKINPKDMYRIEIDLRQQVQKETLSKKVVDEVIKKISLHKGEKVIGQRPKELITGHLTEEDLKYIIIDYQMGMESYLYYPDDHW